ncbi:microtubule-associated serine/threonine-protein kinase 3 [Galendromus occidentalis]|uniref:Serine/threonine-protein kinase greatwall n=1 Tax=Galendromus occidentalis TaxID=34638 RepID=A0AAJ7SI03_9ACAR|nr:microtubule-associated serine/threonine-protein kinase 3 [Galendromus occidentalis]
MNTKAHNYILELDGFKRKNKQRKFWFKRVSKRETRALVVMRKELSTLMKTTKRIRVTRFPQDHYCCEEISLVIYDFLRKIESRTLSYEHVRENLENVFYIQDYFETSVPHSATYMALMIAELLTIVEEVANLLEEAAGANLTRWSWVRQELKVRDKVEPLDPQNMIPLMKNFQQEKLLGAGGFGAVYKAIFGKTVCCTVKLVPISKFKQEKHACVDKVTASVICHPFVVKYYSTFTTAQAYVTVMEYIRGVDLHKVVKAEGGLDEASSRLILFQLGEAILHMHSRGFIHRDVKPSNMMIMPGCRIKLIDFDTVKISLANFVQRMSQFYFERSAHEFRDKETAGTVPFLAPEVLRAHPYGRAIDWWAAGVTAFNVVFARVPFRGEKKSKEFKDLVANAPIPYPGERPISPEMRQFMEDCLVRKASHRICSTNEREFRDHPLFVELDFAGLYAGTHHHELESITAELEFVDDRWSPPGVKAKEDQRVTIEVNELTDTENQCALFTYVSPAFQNCIRKAGRRGGLSQRDRDALETDPGESPFDAVALDPGYRFEKYTLEQNTRRNLRQRRRRRRE